MCFLSCTSAFFPKKPSRICFLCTGFVVKRKKNMKHLTKSEQAKLPGISRTLFMKHLRNQIAAHLKNHGIQIDRAADRRQHYVVFRDDNNNSSNSSTSMSPGPNIPTTPPSVIPLQPMGLPPLPPKRDKNRQNSKRSRPRTKTAEPKSKKQKTHEQAGILYTGLDVSFKCFCLCFQKPVICFFCSVFIGKW